MRLKSVLVEYEKYGTLSMSVEQWSIELLLEREYFYPLYPSACSILPNYWVWIKIYENQNTLIHIKPNIIFTMWTFISNMSRKLMSRNSCKEVSSCK